MAPRRELPVAALLLAALLVGACAAGSVSPSPADTPGASAGAASASISSPGGDTPEPSPTWWPGDVVEATLNLGKADAQIQLAGGDMGAAAAYEDVVAMRGAADGLATLLERLMPEVGRIRDYPATAPAAAAYDQAFPDMLAGAQLIRDSIDKGDAVGLETGSQQLAKGLGAYAEARRLIGPLVEQALLMQRLLVK